MIKFDSFIVHIYILVIICFQKHIYLLIILIIFSDNKKRRFLISINFNL